MVDSIPVRTFSNQKLTEVIGETLLLGGKGFITTLQKSETLLRIDPMQSTRQVVQEMRLSDENSSS